MPDGHSQSTASALYHAAKRMARDAVTNQDPSTHPWLTLERAEEIQMVAAIGAAVSEERARCLRIVHQRLPDMAAQVCYDLMGEIRDG